MRLSAHVDPRRRRRVGIQLGLDRLEGRTLLSVAGVSKFVVYQGRLTTQPTDTYTLAVDRFGFRPGRGNQVLLRVDAQAADGSLDPGAVDLDSTGPRGVQVVSEHGDVGDGTNSVVVAAVGPGPLTIRPTAEGATQGDYTLSVSLAGDVNGDLRVDRADLQAIRAAMLGANGTGESSLTIRPDYDVDGDGDVTMRDWNLAYRNFGASTSFRPMPMTARVSPADDPDGDGEVGEDVEETQLVGKTVPGSVVRLDVGGDGTFDATTTARADGTYSFDVSLSPGANAFAIQAKGPDGQVVTSRLVVTRAQDVEPVTKSYSFGRDEQGWEADFADLPTDANDTYELDSGIDVLPDDRVGYKLQSHNRSDDVFMFLKRKLTAADGIVAGQRYEVHFKITFASNAPSGAVGIGGAPGESVYLKAGASTTEPGVVSEDGYDRLNVDKGNGAQGGTAASVVGNIANGLEPEDGQTEVPYVTLTREHTHTALVQADADGNLWLLVGTDSGFEGLTAIYFQNISVTLLPIVAIPAIA